MSRAAAALRGDRTVTPRHYDLFAITAHGLDGVCAAELAQLGIAATAVQGGVEWRGTAASMYRANLHLRTASRVIARMGVFRARGFAELERRAARLPWLEFLHPGGAVSLRVTCRKSKLYHEGAVAERVGRVLGDIVGVSPVRVADDDTDDDGGRHAVTMDTVPDPAPQLIIVRFMRDVCTISIDSSGALLHQRGYRQAIARAPLRETIAAAMLLVSGWRKDEPLLDPLCGSGTIPIEAALIARGIAPGIARPDLQPRGYAFQSWPGYDESTFRTLVSAARDAVHEARAPIVAADQDAGAITAARSNAERAGVAADIEFRRAELEQMEPVPGVGHVVTNPPYGIRVGEQRSLRRLYAALGSTIASRLPGWNTTLLAADDGLAAATSLPLEERLSTRNGGIAVRLLATSPAAGGQHMPDTAV